MVTELGMSDKVGPINYAERQGSDFLGSELLSGKWHSEETARQIDEEVERILCEAYEEARGIILAEREAIERLTRGLLRYETLDRSEIERLIDGADPEGLRPEPRPEPPTPSEPPAPRAEPRTNEGEGFAGGAEPSPA